MQQDHSTLRETNKNGMGLQISFASKQTYANVALMTYIICDRAKPQGVNRQLLTAKARIQSRGIPCGMWGKHSGTGQEVYEYFGFSLPNIIPPVLNTLPLNLRQ